MRVCSKEPLECAEPVAAPLKPDLQWGVHKNKEEPGPERFKQTRMVGWMAQSIHCHVPRPVYPIDQKAVQLTLSLTSHHVPSDFLKARFVSRICVGPLR
jgi:hypothetical protein